MSGKEPEWDLSEVGGYAAAALTKASREGTWPDDAPGNSARLLVQDLGEFAEAMVACARAGYWSPAKAMERLFVERVEVLMGVFADHAIARRYLDSVAKPATGDRLNRPARKARPEDALSQYLRRAGADDADSEGFRKSWLEMKNLASEWFVHPTAMGPFLSRHISEEPEESVDHWALLIRLLAQACVFTVTAANPLKVTLPVEVVRAIYAAGAALKERGKPDGEVILEMHGVIGEKVSPRPKDAPTPWSGR